MTDDELREHLKDKEWRLENIYRIQNRETGEIAPFKLNPCQKAMMNTIMGRGKAVCPVVQWRRERPPSIVMEILDAICYHEKEKSDDR